MHWQNEKKEKRGVFNFDLKEEGEEREEESSTAQVQCIERISPPGSSCPS